MRRLINWFNLIIKKQKELKRWKRVVTVLAALITFVTTYALILPAITVERDRTEEVAGMYLEKESQDEMLEENALQPVGFGIAADQEDAVTFVYEDDDMTATAIFSTNEDIPEGTELVVNPVDPESEEYADLRCRSGELLDKEFIYDVTTCSFYDFALVCDNIDVTPETGLVDIQICFRSNTVEHVNDVVYAGRYARPAVQTNGFMEMTEDNGTVAAETAGSDDNITAVNASAADNTLEGPVDVLETEDELVSVNPDESSVIEFTDGIITVLSLKGNDLAYSDSLVGILAGCVDEEVKAAAAETDAETPDDNYLQEEDALVDPAEADYDEAALEVRTLKAVGSDYTVILTCDATSGIPEEAALSVSEIAQGTEEYQTYLEETKKAMGLTEEETLPRCAARFFDIKIMVGEDEFIPESGVTVEIAYTEPLAVNPETEVSAVHFQNDASKPEVIDSSATEVLEDGTATVEFTAESFSVYGVIYTVDFHWEVDGEEYEYRIRGGSYISLKDIVAVTGLADQKYAAANKTGGEEASGDQTSTDEVNSINTDNTVDGVSSADTMSILTDAQDKAVNDTRSNTLADVQNDTVNDDDNNNVTDAQDKAESFVAEVDKVIFSNPEYVCVVHPEEGTTVGFLKEKLGLECEYSATLTDEEIDEINAKNVKTGEWGLISIKSFTSEETLTVVMKNGEVYEIRVTDANDAIVINDSTGEIQTISNPSGTKFTLFDYWLNSEDAYARKGWPGYNQSFNGVSQDNGAWVDRHNGNEVGINQGHRLKFVPGADDTVTDYDVNSGANLGYSQNGRVDGINSWNGTWNNYAIYTGEPTDGIVADALYSSNGQNVDIDGFPKLNANLRGESLAYLFDPDMSVSTRRTYYNVDKLLYVDTLGYYTYDSQYYKVSQLDKNNSNNRDATNNFTVSLQPTNDGSEGLIGYWPMGTRNYWNGMHLETDFSIPSNGEVLNPQGQYQPMQFEFAGDDDAWVYVDGILVADGGGLHNRTELDISFKTGEIKVKGGTYTDITNPNTTEISSMSTTLYEIFVAAHNNGLISNEKWESDYNDAAWIDSDGDGDLDTFAPGTTHTFDFFYLERGGSESNLYLRYNLISTTEFSAHKAYLTEDNERLSRDQYKFEIIGFDNTAYTGEYQHAIMPATNEYGSGTDYTSGNGTYDSPQFNYRTTPPSDLEIPDGVSAYRSLITGVAEDGNVNFGDLGDITGVYLGNEYYYIVREIIPDNAVNDNGITWGNATQEQKAAGGFKDANGVVYDQRIYYFKGVVEETYPGSGKYRLKKYRYLDSDYTIPDEDTTFHNFVDGLQPLTLKVLKKNTLNEMLPGASFTLTRANGELAQPEQGATSSVRWVPSNGAVPMTETTGDGGTLSFNGLTEGYYILEETGAPEGYEIGSTYRWLVKVLKQDSGNTIALSTTIQPLDINGNLKGSPTDLVPDSEQTSQFSVYNLTEEELVNITLNKEWLGGKPEELNALFALQRNRTYQKKNIQPSTKVPYKLNIYLLDNNDGSMIIAKDRVTINSYIENLEPNTSVNVNWSYQSYYGGGRWNYKINSTSEGWRNDKPTNGGPITVNLNSPETNLYIRDDNIHNIVNWGPGVSSITLSNYTEFVEGEPTITFETVTEPDTDFNANPPTCSASNLTQDSTNSNQWTYDFPPQDSKGIRPDGITVETYTYSIVEITPASSAAYEPVYVDADGKPLSAPPKTGVNSIQYIKNIPIVSVPVQKTWNWSATDQQHFEANEIVGWSATFYLQYREVLESGEPDAAENVQALWDYVRDDGNIRQKIVTNGSDITNGSEAFSDLPMYKVHENGSVYRLVYAVEEAAYTIRYSEGPPSTWSKGSSGTFDEHYAPVYVEDAGSASNTISVTNSPSQKSEQNSIEMGIQKLWEDENGTAITPDSDYSAKFQLKRYYHEEYLDLTNYNLNELVTVTLITNGKTSKLIVPKEAPVYITTDVFSDGSVDLTYSKTEPSGSSETRTLQYDSDNPSVGQGHYTHTDNSDGPVVFVWSDVIYPTENQTWTLQTSDPDFQYILGGDQGIRPAAFDDADPGDGISPDVTGEIPDESFTTSDPLGQEFELNSDNNWKNNWTNLPQVVEVKTTTKGNDGDTTGSYLTTVVYSYYFEEVESNPSEYYAVYRDSNNHEVRYGDINARVEASGVTIDAINKPAPEIQIYKVDMDKLGVTIDPDEDLLSGATFQIKKYKKFAVNEGDTEEVDTNWGNQGVKNAAYVDPDPNDSDVLLDNGKFVVDGLGPGYYEIDEIHYPAGYIKVTTKPRFQVEVDATTETLRIVPWNSETIKVIPASDDSPNIIVVGNEPGAVLPNTGGSGTHMLYILGLSLISFACAVFVKKRRWRKVA